MGQAASQVCLLHDALQASTELGDGSTPLAMAPLPAFDSGTVQIRILDTGDSLVIEWVIQWQTCSAATTPPPSLPASSTQSSSGGGTLVLSNYWLLDQGLIWPCMDACQELPTTAKSTTHLLMPVLAAGILLTQLICPQTTAPPTPFQTQTLPCW